MADAAILILAAGASRRMRGADKLTMEVDGEPLLARQVRLALATRRPVSVALPAGPHPRRALVEGAQVIDVPEAALGMGHSIAAGVRALRDAPAILLLLADLPEIETADLLAMLAAPRAPGEVLRGATATGEAGHPILFPPSAYSGLMALSGDDGGRAVIGDHPVRLIRLAGNRARLDLDTPESWAEWRAGRSSAERSRRD